MRGPLLMGEGRELVVQRMISLLVPMGAQCDIGYLRGKIHGGIGWHGAEASLTPATGDPLRCSVGRHRSAEHLCRFIARWRRDYNRSCKDQETQRCDYKTARAVFERCIRYGPEKLSASTIEVQLSGKLLEWLPFCSLLVIETAGRGPNEKLSMDRGRWNLQDILLHPPTPGACHTPHSMAVTEPL